MTKILDIQLNAFKERAMLTANEVPGVGELFMPLDHDQLDKLASLAKEARLNALGFEEHKIYAGDLQVGDVIESFGLTVSAIEWGDLHVKVFFEGAVTLLLVADMQLKVNRRIQ